MFPPVATPIDKYVNNASLLAATGITSNEAAKGISLDPALHKRIGKLKRKVRSSVPLASLASNQPLTQFVQPDSLRYIMHTTVGGSPRVLSEAQSLIGPTGLPKHSAL